MITSECCAFCIYRFQCEDYDEVDAEQMICNSFTEEETENEQIADRLDDLASYIANGKVNMTMLRDSISDMRYAIAKLREEANND